MHEQRQRHCDNRTSTCVNEVGTYSCNCFGGFYSKNPWTCDDINECLNTTSLCDPQTSTCFNQIGSYNCSCFSGFQNKDQWTCEDINECVKNANACNTAISTCVNNVGTFSVNKDQVEQQIFDMLRASFLVSGERNLLFAFIGVFGAVILTLISVLAYSAASNQSQLAKANLSRVTKLKNFTM
ncbi:hypothetical protein HELRODRAFT_163130 [Helobdella robusta]|uniref:EGF-like domain-containing protein n=1 Tax=Helobdella robusta TaxID=6412 RepID=T1ETP3_HELRO|nr:hypothetical protein HELRODRAFT_163130 [Helobdella robusta]ESN96101.1 hypothetical protein HELRODRAFT_163130 [Helobdella robusta]